MKQTATLLAAVLACVGFAAGAQDPMPVVDGGRADVIEGGSAEGFEAWLAAFRPRAMAAGITPATLDAAFAGIGFDTSVVEKDRRQSEFTKPIWLYLDTAVSSDRVVNGKAALADNAALLDRIEAAYGVEKEVVVAIWGLETAYGTFRGKTPTVGSLATLAYDTRRSAFFEAELIQALKILQNGDTAPAAMVGSWAGAMGHTQFMPSSWASYAVDFNGDGRRDIWADDPTDALASTANYLKHWGWTTGQPWGYEILLPPNFDYTQSGDRVLKPVTEWQAMGIRRPNGSDLLSEGTASVLLPAGAEGAAFLIFPNFRVIERYNPADAYVIAVGHLSDRIRGGDPIIADWPREDRALTLDERVELQARLAAAGFDPGGVDGKIGPNTVAAVRAYQIAQGLTPDGYASLAILTKLR
ncbi:lytic murein transglycosylase [Allitabrizicola rongguiensis]|uniref:lytic murein transglycosylase n=1 Tax=Alitabrizicola rongguiensis TaxID=2909234 RepID=UPI003872B1BF